MEPKIYMPQESGVHNRDLKKSVGRLDKGKTYKDLSTVIIVPTRGGRSLTPRWVQCMQGLMKPMNQMIMGPIYVAGMEVGDAYNWAVDWIQTNVPSAKFMLTWEDDVMPPPDGLLKLYEATDDYDCVQALYWTKGEEGQPMIYGDIDDPKINFRPQPPIPDTVQRCYGLGMGFNLFRMDQFKKSPKPWFVTSQKWDPATGASCMTQDLYYFERAGKLGLRFACDNRVKCSHYDSDSDICW